MIDVKYANAMTEVLYYLKGIRQEDIDKIPKKLIKFFEENSSHDYICNFDYTKPLKDLNLLEETQGFIAMICLNYWCENETQKKDFIEILNKNDTKYNNLIREKYDVEKIFNNKNNNENENKSIVVYKENLFKKLINKIKHIINRKL